MDIIEITPKRRNNSNTRGQMNDEFLVKSNIFQEKENEKVFDTIFINDKNINNLDSKKVIKNVTSLNQYEENKTHILRIYTEELYKPKFI